MREKSLVVVMTVALMIGAIPCFGANMGKVRGVVTDAEGNKIVDMTVTAINQKDPEGIFTTKTNRRGRFTFMLDPVHFKFAFKKDGYRDYEAVIKVRATTQDIPFQIMSEEQYQSAVATIVAKTPVAQEVKVNENYNKAVDLFATGMEAKKGSEKRSKKLIEARSIVVEILSLLDDLDPTKVEKLPSEEGCHYILGNISWQMEDWEQAEKSFARVSELNPDQAEPYYYRGELAARRADNAKKEGDAEGRKRENIKAVELWSRYLELKPEDDSIVYNLAVLAFQSSKWEISAQNLRRSIGMNSDNATAHWLLAHTQMKLRNWEKAKSAFTKCLELEPEGSHAKDAREMLSVIP